MRTCPTIWNVAVFALACRVGAPHISNDGASNPRLVQSASTQQDWLARARATADNGKKARAVILDGRLGTKAVALVQIAQAFEQTYREKQTPQRLACFAYAAEVAGAEAERYGEETIQLEKRAIEPLLGYPVGAEKGQNLEYFDVGSHFYLKSDNKIPEAWMAYGMYFANHSDRKRAAEAYRKAIQLDPHFGEAWYALADLEFEIGPHPVPVAHIPMILKQVDRAEKEEPRMHLFAVGVRCTVAAQVGDYDTELRLLREMVSANPNTYMGKAQQKIIAALEKQHPGH